MKSSAVNSTSSADSISVRRRSLLPPYFVLDLLDFVADDLPASLLVLQQAADLARALALVGQLVLDDENLEAGEAIQLQLEDRVRLLGVELEALHDLRRRVRLAVGLADHLQDLVERVEDLLEAFEDVDPLLQRVELVLEPLRHDLEAEVEEVPEDGLEVEALRPADFGVLGRDQARQVDDEVRLERRVLEQIRHHHPRIGVPLQLELDPHVVGRHVADVEQRRQLARQHDVGDPFDQRRLVDRVRECW